MDANTKKALVFIVPAVLIIVLVIVAKVVNKQSSPVEKKTESIIDPNLNRKEDTIKTKQRVYAHGQQIEDQQNNDKRVTFETLGEMAKNNPSHSSMGFRDSVANTNQTKNSIYESKPIQKSPVTKTQSPPTVNHKSYTPSSTQPKPQKNESLPVNTNDGKEYSNMGVFVSKNTTNNEQKTSKDDFVPAYLEEDTKIVDKGAVVFILNKDCVINGVQLNKNAVLFGSVVNASTRFDIYIHNVKNTDGTNYDFSNVVVYNERYGRGIVPEGSMSKALKQSADQTANSSTGDMGYSQNVGGTLVEQGVTNTVSAITSSRQPYVKLAQGYKIFIKTLPKN